MRQSVVGAGRDFCMAALGFIAKNAMTITEMVG